MMFIIIMGLPGSGKGTQSVLLQNSFSGSKIISTGNILRQFSEKQENSKLKRSLASGELADDDFVISLVKEKISSYADSHLIFDGFPRNLVQAKELNKIMDDRNIKNKYVIHIQTFESELERRLLNRRICKSCGALLSSVSETCRSCGSNILFKRSDDKLDIIRRRIVDGRSYLDKLIEYYKMNEVCLLSVDGNKSPSQVGDEIFNSLFGAKC